MPKINANGDLEKLVSDLALEMVTAHLHFKLYKDLIAAQTEYKQEMSQTTTFWNMSLHAHLLAVRASLHSIYDLHKSGLNLTQLINAVRGQCPLPKIEIDADLQLVSQTDPLIKKFKWHRDHVFAHKNWQNIVNDKADQRAKVMSYADYESLLQRAETMVNKYAVVLIHNSWRTEMTGGNGHKLVLEGVRLLLKKDEEDHQNELRGIKTDKSC